MVIIFFSNVLKKKLGVSGPVFSQNLYLVKEVFIFFINTLVSRKKFEMMPSSSLQELPLEDCLDFYNHELPQPIKTIEHDARLCIIIKQTS